jgi:hypothetical protein
MVAMPNRHRHLTVVAVPIAAFALAAGGCGGSSSSKPRTGGSSSAEAGSAATGDIPDNQSFLTFRDTRAGFSMRYPEGWAQNGSGRDVTFQDKNNVVRIKIASEGQPTPARVTSEVRKLAAASPTLKAGAPKQVTIQGKRMIKVTYTTQSAPNPVTGKPVKVMVDRYEVPRGGKVAVVELSTPQGVDNVDAYRMMIGSFTWL